MPLLIVPLLKVDGSRGEGLDGTSFFVQQLDVDLVLAAAVAAWCVPEDQCPPVSACKRCTRGARLTDALTSQIL